MGALLAAIVIAVFVGAGTVGAAPGGPSRFMWLGGFQDIDLGTISDSGATVAGQSTCRAKTNCDVEITADNSTASKLTGPGGDSLVTEYALSINGNEEAPFTLYDLFLSPPVQVDYNGGDQGPWMNVEVSLMVRASHPPGDLADAGEYNATQTLTAHW